MCILRALSVLSLLIHCHRNGEQRASRGKDGDLSVAAALQATSVAAILNLSSTAAKPTNSNNAAQERRANADKAARERLEEQERVQVRDPTEISAWKTSVYIDSRDLCVTAASAKTEL